LTKLVYTGYNKSNVKYNTGVL